MKKKIAIICTIGSLLVILDSVNAGQMFLLFLFNGIIPGTNFALSPTIMLSIMIAAESIIVFRASRNFAIQKFSEIKSADSKRRSLKHA